MKLRFYILLIVPLMSVGAIKPNEIAKQLKTIDSLMFIGNFNSAEKLINILTSEESETKEKKLLLNKKAIILYKQKKVIESFSILKSNLSYFKKINDENEQFNILNLIGNLYYDFNHIELAEYYYLEAEKLAKKDDSKEIICFNLVNIYTDKKDVKNYTHYIKLLDNLYSKNKKYDELLLKIKIYKLLYLNSVNKTKTIEFENEIKDVEALTKNSKNELLNIYYKMFLSVYKSNNGNNEESIIMIDSVINEFDKLYFECEKTIAMQIKSEILIKKGDYKNAFLTLTKINTINEVRSGLITKDIIEDFNSYIDSKNKEEEVLVYKNEISKKNNILIGISFLLLLISSSLLYIYKYKIKEREVKIKDVEVNNLKLIIDTEEKERNRIATEIHDGLGGLLCAAKFQLSSSNYEKTEKLIDEIIIESKSISNNLTSELLSRKKLVDVINDYIILLDKNTTNIEFQTINFKQLKDQNLNITIYRIIQELLNNIIKYAKASEVLLQLSIYENKVQISIDDNGVGFENESVKLHNGTGLVNIKKRVEIYQGNIDINSKLNSGTSIYIELNIKNEY